MATEITKQEWIADGGHILDRAFAGEEFVIVDGGRPRVRLLQLNGEERVEMERQISELPAQPPESPASSPRT